MIKRVKHHFFSIPKKIELWALYGAVMFACGVVLNHFVATDVPDYYDVEEEGVPFSEVSDLDDDYRFSSRTDDVTPDGRKDDVIVLSELPAELPARGVDDVGLPRTAENAVGGQSVEQVEQLIEELEASIEVGIEVLPVAQVVKTPVEKPATAKNQYVYDYTIKKGDALSNVLVKAGVDSKKVFFIGRSIQSIYNIKSLRVGQKISITFKELANGDAQFSLLQVFEKARIFKVRLQENGAYKANAEDKVLERKMKHAKGVVSSSLYGVGDKLGVPLKIMGNFIKYYSFDVDFQRDIRKGNSFEVLYEEYYDEQGQKVKVGNLLYGMLTVDGKPLKIYRYSTGKKIDDVDYFTVGGKSLRRSLMKTPINGAVISSPYGKRKHPVLGYTKMHRGVDFAAPRGTPIYAGGDGKIVQIGRNGGYGNYIRIRHGAEYETAYGHVQKFAKGMRKGRRVKQGQIIAYVGTTGRSTGPHLHYEVLKNGKQINLMKAKIPEGNKLNSAQLVGFEGQKEDIKILLKNTQ